MKCDILIRNGRIIDPAENRDTIGDLLIDNGYIIKGKGSEPVDATQVIDATGCLVLPGLIDFHTHLFKGGSDLGILPDVGLLPNGVTTAVDAGTPGSANFEAFYLSVICHSTVRIKTFINVSATGQTTSSYPENVDPQYYQTDKIASLMQKYQGQIVGLKIRQHKEAVHELGSKPLAAAVRMGETLGCPVVVHISNPPCPLEELVDLLRKGDIFVHAYQGKDLSIFDEENGVNSAVAAARQRGVFLDASGGRFHYSFKTIRKALDYDFLPDIIGTDITYYSLYRKPVFGLPYVMSMYLNLGLPLERVIAACTAMPAQALGMAGEIGTLAPGACADVAIFRLTDCPVDFVDPLGEKIVGKMLLVPKLTIRAGQIVFRQIDFL